MKDPLPQPQEKINKHSHSNSYRHADTHTHTRAHIRTHTVSLRIYLQEKKKFLLTSKGDPNSVCADCTKVVDCSAVIGSSIFLLLRILDGQTTIHDIVAAVQLWCHHDEGR